jgi:S-formylglutathione hydrolase FrmB
MQAVILTGVALAAAMGATALSIVTLVRRTRRRRVTATASTALMLAVAAAALSVASGQLWPQQAVAAGPAQVGSLPVWIPTVISTGPGYARLPRLQVPVFPVVLGSATAGRGVAAREPEHGEIASVIIPATTSRFVARPAIVYLPPAALVARPMRLPVIIALSGQSRGAGPADLVRSGDLAATMDHIAATHHGVAPIVVVPDQLGPASANPMCVDSHALGNAATYVLHDVRSWVRSHLPVRTDRTAWTIAGFSEGGTCAIQFAAAHPEIFGSLVDVSGENAPTNGTLTHTIQIGFGGDAMAYRRATPAWVLAHHRYPAEQAYFAAGARDAIDRRTMPVMAARARAAGMTTRLRFIPGVRHNWRVGGSGFAWAFDRLTRWWGI